MLMKFSDIHYKRVDFQDIFKQLESMIEAFVEAETLEEEKELYQHFDVIKSHIDSQYGLLRIHCDLDFNNTIYREEKEYMQKNMSIYETYLGKFYQSICESAFREEWDHILGTYPLAHIEQTLLQFYVEDPSQMSQIHQMMQDEEDYINQYETLRYQINSSDINKEQRKQLEKKMEVLIDVFIKKRNELAKICGYNDYIQMYADSKGYERKQNKKLHQLVKKYIAPLIKKMQQEDYQVISQFPIFNEKESIQIISQIFHDISKETGEFIDEMINNDYLQIHDEKQKTYENYMIYLEAYKAPIVVSDYHNHKGVFHECGHAFQHYLNRYEPSIKRVCLDYEINEAQALSMEFFAGYYISNYGVDVNDYLSYQLKTAIMNICDDCMRDEFECMLYEHPEMTIKQRHEYWSMLEKTYFPYIEQSDCHEWMYIEQYFTDPFYNISYAYAQIVALEFYILMHQDFSNAFDCYMKFCRLSGSASFEDILHMCHLHSPLDEEYMKKLSVYLQK